MSAVIETFIKCDGNGCHVNYGMDNRQYTAKQHRKSFFGTGWVHVAGKDYCPTCRPSNIRTSYPTTRTRVNNNKL